MVKRALDIVVATVAIALLAPILMAIGAAVYLADGGSPLFRQKRVGLHGWQFSLLKFRTMSPGADPSRISVSGDGRVTALGRCLRESKLDELPQLFNVLVGHMSLVGPRPELPCYVRFYNPEQRRVLQFRPGLTDPVSLAWADEGQILARSADPERTYIQDVMPEKLAGAIAYASRATLFTDLGVIGATIISVCRRIWRSARP